MRTLLLFAAIIGSLFFSTATAFSHGADSSVQIDGGMITVIAAFDTGERMSNAQLVIYTPDEPQKEWLTGVANEDGEFSFEIDQTQAGRWAISIREAGHGEVLYLTVAPDGTVSAEAGTNQTVRTVLAVAVVVALAAVAYYFSRSKQPVST